MTYLLLCTSFWILTISLSFQIYSKPDPKHYEEVKKNILREESEDEEGSNAASDDDESNEEELSKQLSIPRLIEWFSDPTMQHYFESVYFPSIIQRTLNSVSTFL